MPTGPSHYKTTATLVRGDGTNVDDYEMSDVVCRCTIGEDHNGDGEPLASMFSDDDDSDDETLSVYDAADIWRSKGMDEDYMFGYSEEELRNAGG
ncbi:hypothetical protein GCM10028801_35940 [Nocardioides maradonensis]